VLVQEQWWSGNLKVLCFHSQLVQMVELEPSGFHSRMEELELFGCRIRKEWTVGLEPFGWWFHSRMVE
jgi:hypothetical protein